MDADVARMIRIELGKFPPPPGMSVKMMQEARLGPNVRPLIDDLVGDAAGASGSSIATIASSCSWLHNVANLLFVGTEGRVQELAVPPAIGAGRSRLAREMLVESLCWASWAALSVWVRRRGHQWSSPSCRPGCRG